MFPDPNPRFIDVIGNEINLPFTLASDVSFSFCFPQIIFKWERVYFYREVENCFFMELTHPWHVMPDIWYSDLYMNHPKSERLSRIVALCFLIGLVEKIITKEDTKHNIKRT